MTADFLEDDRALEAAPPRMDFVDNEILLLKQIVLELQKTHPSQRCVCQLQFNNGQNILTRGTDVCKVQFLHQGQFVKAQLLIVANACDDEVSVTLNEPQQRGVAANDANGIHLSASGSGSVQYIILPVEIEYIEVGLVTTNTTRQTQVNNSAQTVPANGTITVYAFSVPNATVI